MTFNQSLELLKKIYAGNCGRYLELIDEMVDEHILGLRRKKWGKGRFAVLGMFFWGDGLQHRIEFRDCNFREMIGDNNTKSYSFRVDDFLASDWECLLVNYNDYNPSEVELNEKEKIRTFNQVLSYNYGAELLDYNEAVKCMNKLFWHGDINRIMRIDIYALYAECSSVLTDTQNEIKDFALQDILDSYGKDEMFKIEITYKGDKADENLAKWRDKNV